MSNYCTIKDSQKHQTLIEMSGVSSDSVAQVCDEYSRLWHRDPELDEIPNADSSKYLEEKYDIKTSKSGTKYSNTQMILDNGYSTIQEANADINDTHRDLDVKITDINGVSIFEIKSRPSEYKVGNTPYSITATSDTQVQCGIIEALNKMRNCYGINIIPITSEDNIQGISNIAQTKAFVYNGNIYVNIDNATADSSIHEMLHILLGTMSRSNPNLFYQLIGSVENISDYDYRASYYPNRTRNDVNEEIFVEEFAKYLTNQHSIFDNFNEDIKNQIMYYVQRDLDTIFDGNYSVKSLDEVFNCSLKELAELTESNIFNIENGGSLNPSTIHRMLANIKEHYLSNNELTENCE